MTTNISITSRRKNIIYDYLLHFGCSPTAKGFNILSDVIGIAADNPSLKCKELFEEYIKRTDDYGDDGSWKIPYKTARYCFINSEASTRGIYEFIKICSVSVENIKEA